MNFWKYALLLFISTVIVGCGDGGEAFRGTRWGMSKEKVKELETAKLEDDSIEKETGCSILLYGEWLSFPKLEGGEDKYSVRIAYFFTSDILFMVKVAYWSTPDRGSEQFNDDIEKSLIDKYGKPVKSFYLFDKAEEQEGFNRQRSRDYFELVWETGRAAEVYRWDTKYSIIEAMFRIRGITKAELTYVSKVYRRYLEERIAVLKKNEDDMNAKLEAEHKAEIEAAENAKKQMENARFESAKDKLRL